VGGRRRVAGGLRVKIVQVCPRYAPHTGGVETHVQEISERLVDRGHDVTVVTADAGEDAARRDVRNGIEIRRCHGVAPGGAFHVAPGVYRAVRRLDADVVHAHNYHSFPLLFAALAAGDARFVATPHYHGGSASSWRDRLLSAYRPLGGWALRRVDAVVAVSEWEAEQLAADFGVDATVIPNGLDVERFAEAEPEEREEPYLLTVGRLEEYKGLQHAIRALTELAEYDLCVAGSGPYREKLERVAREAGVADRVAFLGYVGDERLPGLYAGAEVFLNLSEFEAYGMTVAEALAAGTPCVVREAGALSEWAAEESCIGASSVEPDHVADAVRSVAGRRADPAVPSWTSATDSIETVYRN
jgi:glycosyltransferase involved in cell wall biosynthesis